MRILAIAERCPMPDRSSGDLRFYELLRCLAREHEVALCAYRTSHWLSHVDSHPYRAALEASTITVRGRNPIEAITSQALDAIIFEFYFAGESYLDVARFWQPNARLLVDSVDVHFHRLLAKAHVTRSMDDYTSAQEMKRRELAVYRKADVVIAVSDEDRSILRREAGNLPVEVIPNIHVVPPLAKFKQSISKSLLFIGNFRHDPNVDAMLYFCREVLPLIKRDVPDVRLTIVGDSAPEEVKALGSETIRVLGFVPDTAALLEASEISIAPLRYGGGMKGKIGEAMAHGLPVVTTSVGTEGFGLTPGQNILVGDNAVDFARNVVQLLSDRALYERLRKAAWTFVNERYSVSAVAERIRALFSHLDVYPVKKLPLHKRAEIAARHHLSRSILWRLKPPMQ
jgi:glycosyltransferase involved in cell wall biosynthesis